MSTAILTDPSPSYSANIQQVLIPLSLSLLEHSGVIFNQHQCWVGCFDFAYIKCYSTPFKFKPVSYFAEMKRLITICSACLASKQLKINSDEM